MKLKLMTLCNRNTRFRSLDIVCPVKCDLATTLCWHKSIAYYNIYSKISCWREGWTLWQSMMSIA